MWETERDLLLKEALDRSQKASLHELNIDNWLLFLSLGTDLLLCLQNVTKLCKQQLQSDVKSGNVSPYFAFCASVLVSCSYGL